ncbi:hypothetical protein H4R35_002786 [Dimargaris xerosporica]|nr:hypothetical protein H4R35_002786 [Dimargaris xerosporica]
MKIGIIGIVVTACLAASVTAQTAVPAKVPAESLTQTPGPNPVSAQPNANVAPAPATGSDVGTSAFELAPNVLIQLSAIWDALQRMAAIRRRNSSGDNTSSASLQRRLLEAKRLLEVVQRLLNIEEAADSALAEITDDAPAPDMVADASALDADIDAENDVDDATGPLNMLAEADAVQGNDVDADQSEGDVDNLQEAEANTESTDSMPELLRRTPSGEVPMPVVTPSGDTLAPKKPVNPSQQDLDSTPNDTVSELSKTTKHKGHKKSTHQHKHHEHGHHDKHDQRKHREHGHHDKHDKHDQHKHREHGHHDKHDKHKHREHGHHDKHDQHKHREHGHHDKHDQHKHHEHGHHRHHHGHHLGYGSGYGRHSFGSYSRPIYGVRYGHWGYHSAPAFNPRIIPDPMMA